MIREQLGYFEEFLLDPDENPTPKCLGTLNFSENSTGRVLGYAGRETKTLTESITLRKGHREVTYKASAKRPIKVVTMLQRLEGKQL